MSSFKAPEWNVPIWVDGAGNKIEPIQLSDFDGKFKVVFCFQSWCAGCHSIGFPSLKRMVEAFKDSEKIVFLVAQTVFEGQEENTFEAMLENQRKYDLGIPFAQDNGDETTGNVSNIMFNYQTGGTPWFILIDEESNVVFSDFHIHTENAIEFLRELDSGQN